MLTDLQVIHAILAKLLEKTPLRDIRVEHVILGLLVYALLVPGRRATTDEPDRNEAVPAHTVNQPTA
jgi:hypothetical protein